PSSAEIDITASDAASASLKPSATNARVIAVHQRPKMTPASADSSGSSSAPQPIAAATTGQPALKSPSISRRSQYLTYSRSKTLAPRSTASSMVAVMESPE